jgi:hypothetical protein
MTIGAYNAVRVSDLEIAMVLARELRALPGRPTLTLAQLQSVFDAERLDGPERERIGAALEAAGLRTAPSVLDAHPDEPLALESFAPVETEAPAPEPAPSPRTPTGLLVIALLLAVAFTTVGGWPFGLVFVALAAISARAAPRRSARP